MKRRPTASDRELASAFCRLPDGAYSLRVSTIGGALTFTNLATLKSEGGFVYDDTEKRLEVSPVYSRSD